MSILCRQFQRDTQQHHREAVPIYRQPQLTRTAEALTPHTAPPAPNQARAAAIPRTAVAPYWIDMIHQQHPADLE